jgi:hypothetical protein
VTGRLGAVCLMTCIGGLAAGCGDDDDTSVADTAAPTAATAPTTTGAPIVATTIVATTIVATTQPLPSEGLIAELDVLGSPDWLAADEHGVWVHRDDSSVILIDPASNEIVDTVDIGGALCQGIGAGDGSIWACADADVARIDAGHPEIISVLPVGKTYQQGELSVADGQVWLLIGDGSTLQGYLTDTQDVWSRFQLPVRGTDLGVGDAGLWVISSVDDAAVEVDLGSGQVLDTVAVTAPVDVAVDGEVWIGTPDETVRVNASGEIDLRIPAGTGAEGSIVLTPAEVWIRNIDPLLTRADRETGEIIESYTAAVTSGGDTVYAFGSVWTSAADDAKIFRFAAPA